MKQTHSLTFLVLMFALSSSLVNADGLAYRVHYLGVLPGTQGSRAVSINNSGQVTGMSATANDMSGVFLWSKETGMTDIRVPGSLDYFGGINDLGEVVGSYSAPVDVGGGPAVREPDGTIRKISNTAPYPYGSGGNALNGLGQIAGYCGLYAAIWQNDKIIWASDVMCSQASDINDKGQAVWNASGPNTAYYWDANKGSTPLALLDGTQTCWANSINEAGQIAGYSGNHAVLWQTDGTAVDLGYGIARGVNSSGWVVGELGNKSTMWNPDGVVIDLSRFVGGYDSDAYSINDNGWIAGSVDINGFQQAVVWEPVPEPSSILALLSGLAGIGGMVIRGRK